MMSFGAIQGWLHGSATAQLKALAAGSDPLKLLAAMAIAAVFGMVHALMPGHGKAVIVSYYLGRPARLFGSIVTSAILVLTHIGSAVVLVLAGFMVIRRTIGGAGRAPAFEVASAALVIAVGLWLLFRALHPHEQPSAATDGRVLAFVTGLVPCPLTTFIMVYAVSQGMIAAGLLVTAGMAVGMTMTIALFALAAVLLHDRFLLLMERTDDMRRHVSRGLEIASAIAIIVFGTWLLATRSDRPAKSLSRHQEFLNPVALLRAGGSNQRGLGHALRRTAQADSPEALRRPHRLRAHSNPTGDLTCWYTNDELQAKHFAHLAHGICSIACPPDVEIDSPDGPRRRWNMIYASC